MDTVEELNGTYFYKGMINLSAPELLFWVMIDAVEEQLGVQDMVAIASLILGGNYISVPGKPLTATKGTSPASLFFRKNLRYIFKSRVLPTLTQKSFSLRGIKIFWVNNLGAFVGRAVPVVGWVILANDVAQISIKTATRYNNIARMDDQLW
ncbi:STM2901 family protein [Yersinia enterocolitica]|uniref:STM2901 family protein n=1 Tax=Yersinia enterocolitica TaxID=630 RepID=UPI003D7A757A